MRILVADDHALFRRGLGLVLADLFDGIEVAEATCLDEALDVLARGPRFDVALLDLAMPGMCAPGAPPHGNDRFAGLRRLRAAHPDTRVVMLSAYSGNEDVAAAIGAGAAGYIPKSASDHLLKHALSLVMEGEMYVPPSVLSALHGQPPAEAAGLDTLSADNPLRALTPRQREILGLLMRGQSNKEIGRNLDLLESTVKAHIKVILQKLKVANRTQAAMLAAELGWPGGGHGPAV